MNMHLEVKLFVFKEEKDRLLKELMNIGSDRYNPKVELLTFMVESINGEIFNIKSQLNKDYELNKAKELDSCRKY